MKTEANRTLLITEIYKFFKNPSAEEANNIPKYTNFCTNDSINTFYSKYSNDVRNNHFPKIVKHIQNITNEIGEITPDLQWHEVFELFPQ